MLDMHEFSMAQSAIRKILEIAGEYRAKKDKYVKLVVGELTFLNIDQLKFALNTLSKGTILENCMFDVVVEKLKVRCRDCGFESECKYDGEEYHVPDILDLTLNLICPKCKSLNIDILSGRSFTIKNMKIITETKSNPNCYDRKTGYSCN